MSIPSSSRSGGGVPKGISLTNTVYCEVASCLPLPCLPVLCGALDEDLRLLEEQASSRTFSNSSSVAGKIADLLRNTDVSYLNLKNEAGGRQCGSIGSSKLNDEVLRRDPLAFEHISSGPSTEPMNVGDWAETKPVEQSMPVPNQVWRDSVEPQNYQQEHCVNDDASNSSRKPKIKKKRKDNVQTMTCPDALELQDSSIRGFCEMLEDLCGKAEAFIEERDEAEWIPLTVADLKAIVNEIMLIRAKEVLHMVPEPILLRTLNVLDNQIHRAEGLSIDDCEHADAEVMSCICCALESIHAALAIMAHDGMPKMLYKEENIERIIEFSRRQIMDVMFTFDPVYRSLHRPTDNGAPEDVEDEEFVDLGSASKKRRISSGTKVRKSKANRMASVANVVLQKLCTIISFLTDLLSIERLSDSCILQLVRASLQTLLVDNIQVLQLKAIGLIGGVYRTYSQHRAYVMDETLQILLKLPLSKRVPRAYHLPDEEPRQIQLITALLIQVVHYSPNVPEVLRRTLRNPSLEIPIDSGFPSKCHEAVIDSCCLFWSRVLQRYTGIKAQDASELKIMIENIVMDLLTTLNLPEYPASGPILEVLCVLLLQNAGPKSKDNAARTMAIDLLGTIAARLKHDAVLYRKEKFWTVTESISGDTVDSDHPTDACCVCLETRIEKLLFVCQGCERAFHIDCLGGREHEVTSRNSYCQICLCEKQLVALRTYIQSRGLDDEEKNHNHSRKSSHAAYTIAKQEIMQQMLLNFLQDTGSSSDLSLFIRWSYLCLWYKDDPGSEQKFFYNIARLKSKEIVRDSCSGSFSLTRDSVKRITLALGQNSSFARGFDKILHRLLASLTENSPVIRAKALRAVSIIVEADPEVLCDKIVQTAVEGRFCDSAISVREAALELVGRHIASHPDVGLKYFEKVAERIKDTGISVRKRAIKIIRDMCTSNSDFSEFTTACVEIISRSNDEESSIQDLVCKTFYEFWFEEHSSSQSHFYEDGSCVPLEVTRKTEQVVEMLRRMSSHQPLVIVIKRILALDFLPQSAKAVGINPVLLASVRRRCESMCKCLLEKILQVSETINEEGEGHMLPFVLLLHAFCLVDPTLCAPASDPSQFVVTLQPYLKSQSDNRVSARLLENIIFIMDSVLPLMRKFPQIVAEELEQDLKQMIVRHSFLTIIHACIKCLCSVSKVSGKGGGVVQYLIQLFYKRLDALGFDNKQQVGRCLFCLGLLIRYGGSLVTTSASDKNIDVSSSLNLFRKYLRVEDFVVKVRSLQALGNVLIARPEFMLQTDIGKILETTFSSNADVRLKMQSLQNMYEYLLDAESQMETDKTRSTEVSHPLEGGHSVPVAAGAGDTNICGCIVQLYWDKILSRSLDANLQVRQAALKIVEIVLRQGLVHPIICVPYLIALETDPLEENSKLAHHLLTNMNEKYPSFFESRLGDGLQLSFVFIQNMNQGSPENLNLKPQSRLSNNVKGKSDTAYARLGVSRIYKLIRGNRISRNKFMSSVLRKFETPSWDESLMPFLIYCAEILALLPFSLPDEPLYLVYSINRVIQVRAGTLESDMKDLMQTLQRSNQNINVNGSMQSDPVSYKTTTTDSNQIVSELEGHHLPGHAASMDLNMHASASGNCCTISNDALRKIQACCLAAGALHLLLKLKRHLKIVYGLDDGRCQAYSPNDPIKPGEGLSRQNVTFNIGDINVNPPINYEDFYRRYQEFKNALREDTVDYSTYTANIKRKRPTPRKVGKSSRMVGVDDDADDDEDWGGGARRIFKGGRRGTRQRF